MTVGSSSEKFREWCKQLEENPTSQGPDITTKTAGINSVFTALNSKDPTARQITISEGKQINVKDLNMEDMKVFTSCTKRFFKKNIIPESQVGDLLKNINDYQKRANNIQFRSSIQQEVLNQTTKAKQQLLLHEEIAKPQGDSQGEVAAEVTNRLIKISQKEQEKAQNEYKEMPRGAKKWVTILVTSVGGTSTLVGGIALGTAISVGSVFWPIGVALLGVGLIVVAFNIPNMIKFLFTIPEQDSASTAKLEMLEELRKLSPTKEFDAFAKDPKNHFKEIKKDSDLIKFLQIYKLQKSYQNDHNATRFQEMNTLRGELGLTLLKVEEFRG